MVLRHKASYTNQMMTHTILPLSVNREVVCFQLTKLYNIYSIDCCQIKSPQIKYSVLKRI